MKIPNEAITHNGRFHTDDVFSAALLKILNPQINIVRKNSVPEAILDLYLILVMANLIIMGREVSFEKMESSMLHLAFFGRNTEACL